MAAKSLREKVYSYIKKEYSTVPEYPWTKYPDYAVFRHEDNKKWFGVVMNISPEKLGIKGSKDVEILNVKMDDLLFKETLLREKGYFPGYHMNKGSWISILLDGTVSYEDICSLIDASFAATASKKKKDKMRPPKDWIIPANPKFYDVIGAFEQSDEIDWKQGNGIKAGDTVYMYVAPPISAILYKCKVLETDIPYKYQDENLTIKALMKIKREKQYEKDDFTFDRLKDEFGIFAIRGPRGITNKLKLALEKTDDR